jgi:hypothetical protein
MEITSADAPLPAGEGETVEVPLQNAAAPPPSGNASVFGFVLSVVSQQLLEEIGLTQSTETEENAKISKELEKLRTDCLSMEELLLALSSSYALLQTALGGFGEQLYQLAIKEEEPKLAGNCVCLFFLWLVDFGHLFSSSDGLWSSGTKCCWPVECACPD